MVKYLLPTPILQPPNYSPQRQPIIPIVLYPPEAFRICSDWSMIFWFFNHSHTNGTHIVLPRFFKINTKSWRLSHIHHKHLIFSNHIQFNCIDVQYLFNCISKMKPFCTTACNPKKIFRGGGKWSPFFPFYLNHRQFLYQKIKLRIFF